MSAIGAGTAVRWGTEIDSAVRIGVPVTTVWTEPSAVRLIDAAAVAAQPDAGGWARALDDASRLDLLGRTVTQALLGEPVLVVGERRGWSEIRLPEQPSHLDDHGYPGWVPTAHLTGHRSADGPAVVITARVAGTPELSMGTIVPGAPDDGGGGGPRSESVTVLHPNGARLTLPRSATRLLADPADPLTIARTLTGSRYLWAGMSGYGVDCSGLVHLAYRIAGWRVPRDADDQARWTDETSLEDAAAGDPVFFTNDSGLHHVGLITSDTRMLHAPRTGRTVVCEPVSVIDRTARAEGREAESVTAGHFRR